jgi:hypothetical protein
MQIAARKILFLVVPFQLSLLASWASAQDASTSSILPEQIATAVEGGASTPPPNAGSYTIQNDLLTGAFLFTHPTNELAGGWMAPAHAPDLVADPDSEQLADLNDKVDVLRDPNEPRAIQLSDGIRGRLKAKSGGAMIGIAIGFW